MGSERQLDSTILGRDVYSLLGESVTIGQSAELRSALDAFAVAGAAEQFNGFRVRIYLDSRLGSRDASLSCIRRFNAMYPGVLAFRSYSAPNYKVTVGNFRTKLEAERFLREIKASFPEAFVVRDKFKYPSLNQPELVESEVLVSEDAL